jgi:hypothetical protein
MLACWGLGGRHASWLSEMGINHSDREVGEPCGDYGPTSFCHLSTLHHGLQNIAVSLWDRWLCVFSGRVTNAPMQWNHYQNPGKGEFAHAIGPRWRNRFIYPTVPIGGTENERNVTTEPETRSTLGHKPRSVGHFQGSEKTMTSREWISPQQSRSISMPWASLSPYTRDFWLPGL